MALQIQDIAPLLQRLRITSGMKYVRESNSTQHPNPLYHSPPVELRFGKPPELSAFLALEMQPGWSFPRQSFSLPVPWDIRDDTNDSGLVTWVGWECYSARVFFPATQDSQEGMEGSTRLSCVPLWSLFGLWLQRLEFMCCQCVSPGWVDELRRFISDIST